MNSTLTLYPNCDINFAKNFCVDAIDLYLLSLPNQVVLSNFQYQKVDDINSTVKVVLSQSEINPVNYVNSTSYNYCEIDNGNNKTFHFITARKWKSTNCVEFTLRMDTLNTLYYTNDDDPEELVRFRKFKMSRGHFRRFLKTTTSGSNQWLANNIDFESEGINPVLFSAPTTRITTSDYAFQGSAKWYLIYKTANTGEVSTTNPCRMYYCASEQLTVSSKTIYALGSIDLSDPTFIKIIRLPYCPEALTGSSPSALGGTAKWSYDEAMHMRYFNGTPGQLISNDFYVAGTSTDNPASDLFTQIPTSSILKTKPRFIKDTKLKHSEFHYHKFLYDSFSLAIASEKVRQTSYQDLTSIPTYYIEWYISRNVVSSMLFKFTNYIMENQTNEGSSDFPNVLLVKRNNEVAIYNDAYLNYLKIGYNYDQKQKQDASMNSMIAMVGSSVVTLAGMLISLTGAGSPIGLPMAVGGIVGIATSGASLLFKDISAQNSIDQKLQELQSQSASVSGSDDSDLLEAYDGNILKHTVYQASELMMRLLDDLFYYYGYKRTMYLTPDLFYSYTTSRYWFNFISGDIEFDNTYNLSEQLLTDIRTKFSDGVTFLHANYVNGAHQWDFKQEKENWEVSIFGTLL